MDREKDWLRAIFFANFSISRVSFEANRRCNSKRKVIATDMHLRSNTKAILETFINHLIDTIICVLYARPLTQGWIHQLSDDRYIHAAVAEQIMLNATVFLNKRVIESKEYHFICGKRVIGDKGGM